MSAPNDFDFLCRDWAVRHRKLATRLAGADDWYEFDGTSSTRSIMDGYGNVEDNFLDDRDGPYRAAALRSFEAQTGLWRIWWFDLRFQGQANPPVMGRFEGNVGEFAGDDTWNGTPIQVRFLWRKDAGNGPRWEQAFSMDRGATWETNWVMDFALRGCPGA